MSASIAIAWPPASVIWLAIRSSRSARRATSATAAPWPASALAVASPIPLLAPVTSATVPSRRSAIGSTLRRVPSMAVRAAAPPLESPTASCSGRGHRRRVGPTRGTRAARARQARLPGLRPGAAGAGRGRRAARVAVFARADRRAGGEADVFLDELEALLLERGVSVLREAKPTFTQPAPADLRREIAERCDAVIEAIAD